jgi:putative endonuclease
MTRDRAQAEARGRRGESIAAWWLRLHGWRIIARRVKTIRGEVDLVAKRGNTLAFVEVKMRRTQAELDIAIDDYRLRRVVAAAELLYPKYARGNESAQIDVILVAPWRWPQHLVNVWHG